MKKAFLLKNNWIEIFDNLSDKKAGVLIKSLFKYNVNGEKPTDLTDMEVNAYFNVMLLDCNAMNENYDKRCETSALNGRLGGAPKGNSNSKKQPNQPKKQPNQPNQPKQADNDNDNENDNDNDNENDNENKSPNGDMPGTTRPLSRLDEFLNYISLFNETRGTWYQPIDKVRKQFTARLKEGFTPAQMIEALKNAMNDRYHIDTAYKYLTPEFFTRSDKIDRFLNAASPESTNPADDFEANMMKRLNEKQNETK